MNKTKIILSLTIMCLLFMSTSSKAAENVLVGYDVKYPRRVREGEMFEIKIFFDYPDSACCIHYYGEQANVWLYIALNDEYFSYNRPDSIRRSSDYSDDLRPEFIPFYINTSVRNYVEGDIFKFQIRYASGAHFTFPVNFYLFVDYVYTEVYEIKIRSPVGAALSFVSIIIPFMIFATIIYLRKIKSKNEMIK